MDTYRFDWKDIVYGSIEIEAENGMKAEEKLMEMTIEELASTILNKIGGKSEIIYKELPEDDPKIRQPDITRAKRILNWNPKTSFDIGLEETIKDFKIRLGLN